MTEMRCNKCLSGSLKGKCYRTKCNHVLCETCACCAFDRGSACPVCHLKLFDGDVKELMIGITPLPLHDAMFQTAFQSTNWPTILENSFQVVCGSMEVSLFVQHQLYQDVMRRGEENVELAARYDGLNAEKKRMELQYHSEFSSMEQKIRELEHCIQGREKELCEVKEAYVEKSRKCEAWEKAYTSLRENPHLNDIQAPSWPAHFASPESALGVCLRPLPIDGNPPSSGGMKFNVPGANFTAIRPMQDKEPSTSRFDESFTSTFNFPPASMGKQPIYSIPSGVASPTKHRNEAVSTPPPQQQQQEQKQPPPLPSRRQQQQQQRHQVQHEQHKQRMPQGKVASSMSSTKWCHTASFFNGTTNKKQSKRNFFDR